MYNSRTLRLSEGALTDGSSQVLVFTTYDSLLNASELKCAFPLSTHFHHFNNLIQFDFFVLFCFVKKWG